MGSQLALREIIELIPWPVVREYASAFSFRPELVAAVILTESWAYPYAVRFEPEWSDDWLLAPDEWAQKIGSTEATEIIGQKTSWGPLQIMGATARDFGFDSWFPELCEWETSLEYGLRYLSEKRKDHGDDPMLLYAAYNAGTVRWQDGTKRLVNEKNVNRFLRILDNIEKIARDR